MHVAVDAANLPRDRRGIGRYVRAMLARWLDQRERLRITLLVPDMLPTLVRRRFSAVLGRDDLEICRRADVRSLRPDLVWYPWNGMTWASGVASVATVHDVWPFVSPAPGAATRRREQTAYSTMAANARAIIANSHFTKSEILKHLPIPPERIHVVHMGTDMPRQDNGREGPLPQLEGMRRYVLFVGEDEPRKDLGTLRAAMRLLPAELRASTGLVIAGKAKKGPAGRLLHDTPVLTFVAGEVSDEILDRLYASAGVFAFPSRYEGFGLPVLEAMARGVPVVASDAGSMPEVGGDAALYFPVGDARALAAALARILSDAALAGSLRAAGVARAAEFSWERCSERTLRIFEDAVRMVSA